jgi:hypothetical protein
MYGRLVAPRVTMELAENCRELELQFIDTAGNAYASPFLSPRSFADALILSISWIKLASTKKLRTHPQNRNVVEPCLCNSRPG